jgi:hypothetical protein
MTVLGSKAVTQSTPQYTALSACQGLLVSMLARAWVGPQGQSTPQIAALVSAGRYRDLRTSAFNNLEMAIA